MRTFIDLFCGIGGFHLAAANNGMECVFASEIDKHASAVYEANFGIRPAGDIANIPEKDIPNHDLLCAGFPCQPFSVIGQLRGFDDVRGTLFYDIVRIMSKKKPAAVILENVSNLSSHDGGRTLRIILAMLKKAGYSADWRILDALDFGLPQSRRRTVIVAFREHEDFTNFYFPDMGGKDISLESVLEENVADSYYAPKYIQDRVRAKHKSPYYPGMWHTDKSGRICSRPYSYCLRANPSTNYLLVNGQRRLTEREMMRLQGFPDSCKHGYTYTQARKQCGNAVAVPVMQAVIRAVKEAQRRGAFITRAREIVANIPRIPECPDKG